MKNWLYCGATALPLTSSLPMVALSRSIVSGSLVSVRSNVMVLVPLNVSLPVNAKSST